MLKVSVVVVVGVVLVSLEEDLEVNMELEDVLEAVEVCTWVVLA